MTSIAISSNPNTPPYLSSPPPSTSIPPHLSTRSFHTTPPKLEKSSFKAETRQLLDIVTNSIYTDSEVFVRELISNGSDSLEKLRHLEATNDSKLKFVEGAQEGVVITTDEECVIIEDGGVGMTKEELEVNLGTIARSGSREFVSEGKDADGDIIGKFGVGFYSAFMVGERVEVHSKSAMEDGGWTWKSDGGGEFEVR